MIKVKGSAITKSNEGSYVELEATVSELMESQGLGVKGETVTLYGRLVRVDESYKAVASGRRIAVAVLNSKRQERRVNLRLMPSDEVRIMWDQPSILDYL